MYGNRITRDGGYNNNNNNNRCRYTSRYYCRVRKVVDKICNRTARHKTRRSFTCAHTTCYYCRITFTRSRSVGVGAEGKGEPVGGRGSTARVRDRLAVHYWLAAQCRATVFFFFSHYYFYYTFILSSWRAPRTHFNSPIPERLRMAAYGNVFHTDFNRRVLVTHFENCSESHFENRSESHRF